MFVTTPEGKERLKPALDRGNVAQTMAAPATAILAYDLEFYEKLPLLVPHRDARSDFVGKPELIRYEAMRSGTLQGAYLIVAARALGLDCGPMGGFDHAKVDAEFFPEGTVKSNFLVQPRLRRPVETAPARAAPAVRGRLPDRVTRAVAAGGPAASRPGGQSIRSYAGSVRNSTNVSLPTSSAKMPAASSYLPAA